MAVAAAMHGPSQGSDEDACRLNVDASGIALVVLASVDGASNSIAKTDL
jgi:hypothetical protein